MSFLNPFRGSSTSKAKGTAGSPLELINYDTSTGKFNLGKEALDVLRSVRVTSVNAGTTVLYNMEDQCFIEAMSIMMCR